MAMYDQSMMLARADERIRSLEKRIRELEDALIEITKIHHSTIVGSKLHNPARQDWDQCSCKTCMRVAKLLERR